MLSRGFAELAAAKTADESWAHHLLGRPGIGTRCSCWGVMVKEASFVAPRYVVGIGASAGGLDPLVRFFDNLPKDTGMAFVIVQHLSPDFKSLMDELLGRHTMLPIHLVEDGMPVEADHVYLIPAKKEMIISGGRLLWSERDRQQELTLPIDMFFRSLAQDCGERAIAIVLSGGGSDGSRGICHVREAGGLVYATGRDEHIIRPKRQLPVAGSSRLIDTSINKLTANSLAANARIHEQQAKPADRIRLAHKENAADRRAGFVRYPATLAVGLVVLHERRDDLGDEPLELEVPPVLLAIDDAMALDDPAHVAGMRLSQREGVNILSVVLALAEQHLDPAHRRNESLALCR